MLRLGLLLATLAGCTEAEPPLDFRNVPSGALAILASEAEFTNIREVFVTGKAIWVLDTAPPFLTRFDRQGGPFLRSGEHGEGPGEFSFPVALQVDRAAGTAHVWDLGNRRHSVFDAALTPVRAEPVQGAVWSGRKDIREVSYTDPHRVRLLERGVLVNHFPAPVNRTADFVGGSLNLADRTLSPERALVRFAEHTESGGGDPREFVAVPLWDYCGPDLVVWRPRSNDLAWQRDDGTLTASVRVPGRSSPIEAPDIAAFLEEMARHELGPGYTEARIDFAAMAGQARDRFADYAPFATQLLCSPEGTAWLQLFDNRTDPLGRGRVWLRVTRSGIVEGIEFPQVFRPIVATASSVLGSYESPAGVQWLAEWRDASDGDG